MVLMVVPGLQWPALPQILLFGLAAWWFVLRAVAWRPAPAGMHAPAASPGRGRAERAGRGSLLYDALTMAAMAYMLVAMDLHGAYGTLAVSDAAGIPDQAPHHAGPAVALSLPGALPVAEQGWVSQSAVVLALAFGLAGAVWCLLLFRRLSTPGRPRSGKRSWNSRARRPLPLCSRRSRHDAGTGCIRIISCRQLPPRERATPGSARRAPPAPRPTPGARNAEPGVLPCSARRGVRWLPGAATARSW